MNSSNTIFFSTASSGYVSNAAISLLSIRGYVPDAKLFIMSSGMSHEEKEFLLANNIQYHEIDLSDIFTKTWDYPIECYYLFAGPALLVKLGYDYSVYIDGDVVCTSEDVFLEHVDCITGVESAPVNGEYTSIFGSDWTAIQKNWKLPGSIKKTKRIQSGIVYFNNSVMVEIGLLEKIADLYSESLTINIPRKGDDSLFSLFQYVHLKDITIDVISSRYNFIPQFNGGKSPGEDLVFFHFTGIKKPWEEASMTVQASHDDKYYEYRKEWLLTRNNAVWTATRYSKLKRLITHQYLALKGLRKNYVQKNLNIRKSPIKLYWWHDHGSNIANFGDEVTRDVLMRVFGYRSEYAPPHEATLAGAGSILEILSDEERQQTLNIWGSGFIRQPDENLTYRMQNIKFHAVRGEITKHRLKIDKDNIVLGDPGILASVIYDKATYSTDKIGVVVHYIDADLPIVRSIKYDPRFMIISPLDTPENVAKNISSCRMILSSSLHGLIFADSFNIPNAHIQLSDNVVGGSYKFRDYYSGTGREYKPADASRIFDSDYLKELRLQYIPVDNLRAHQRRLIRAFPKF